MKKYVSDNYKLQEESTCTGKISTADELVVKAQYMICMKKQKSGIGIKNMLQVISVPAWTILHTCINIVLWNMFKLYQQCFQ